RGRESPAGEANHACAGFETIDRRLRICPNELSEKAPVSLAHDEDPPRRIDLPNECGARLLQLRTENQRLEPAIMPRDPVEIHRSEKGSAASGVRRTRSARAVRLSRGRWWERFSLTSRKALPARQSQSGQAKCQKTPHPIKTRVRA